MGQDGTDSAVATAVGLVSVAAAAATVGFLLGRRRLLTAPPARSEPPAAAAPEPLLVGEGGRRRGDLCECGVLLPKTCTSEERERHRASNRHRANMLKLDTSCKVVVTEEVSEYRAAATKLVKSDDCVLEVGSHVGGTTKVLATLCRRLIGVDQQANLIAQARVNLPDVQFEVLDVFDTPKTMSLVKSIAPDKFHKVFIDISGSRDITTVVRLMDFLDNALKPEVMVVKSQALKRLLLRSQLWVDHPGCGDGGAARKGRPPYNL
mmetsp:Transcript_9762/g.21445  ORF Transcript_9762/g.21445 Transcript_9762/m.21445 type:complete len:264 (-) Transcript_9762:791-1582(-)